MAPASRRSRRRKGKPAAAGRNQEADEDMGVFQLPKAPAPAWELPPPEPFALVPLADYALNPHQDMMMPLNSNRRKRGRKNKKKRAQASLADTTTSSVCETEDGQESSIEEIRANDILETTIEEVDDAHDIEIREDAVSSFTDEPEVLATTSWATQMRIQLAVFLITLIGFFAGSLINLIAAIFGQEATPPVQEEQTAVADSNANTDVDIPSSNSTLMANDEDNGDGTSEKPKAEEEDSGHVSDEAEHNGDRSKQKPQNCEDEAESIADVEENHSDGDGRDLDSGLKDEISEDLTERGSETITSPDVENFADGVDSTTSGSNKREDVQIGGPDEIAKDDVDDANIQREANAVADVEERHEHKIGSVIVDGDAQNQGGLVQKLAVRQNEDNTNAADIESRASVAVLGLDVNQIDGNEDEESASCPQIETEEHTTVVVHNDSIEHHLEETDEAVRNADGPSQEPEIFPINNVPSGNVDNCQDDVVQDSDLEENNGSERRRVNSVSSIGDVIFPVQNIDNDSNLAESVLANDEVTETPLHAVGASESHANREVESPTPAVSRDDNELRTSRRLTDQYLESFLEPISSSSESTTENSTPSTGRVVEILEITQATELQHGKMYPGHETEEDVKLGQIWIETITSILFGRSVDHLENMLNIQLDVFNQMSAEHGAYVVWFKQKFRDPGSLESELVIRPNRIYSQYDIKNEYCSLIGKLGLFSPFLRNIDLAIAHYEGTDMVVKLELFSYIFCVKYMRQTIENSIHNLRCHEMKRRWERTEHRDVSRILQIREQLCNGPRVDQFLANINRDNWQRCLVIHPLIVVPFIRWKIEIERNLGYHEGTATMFGIDQERTIFPRECVGQLLEPLLWSAPPHLNIFFDSPPTVQLFPFYVARIN